jgi:hypothetical protein
METTYSVCREEKQRVRGAYDDCAATLRRMVEWGEAARARAGGEGKE